jgi:hypothetical protein
LIGDRRTVGDMTEFAGHVAKRSDHAKLAEARSQGGQGNGETGPICPTMEAEGLR